MSVFFINVYKTEPADQEEMATIIKGAVENFARKQPGFIGASVYRSTNTGNVTEVVEWEREEDWQAANELCKATNPDVGRVLEIAKPESALYHHFHSRKG